MKKLRIQQPSQIELGKHIERVRLQKGMTRKQLGKAVKVTEQQIEKYEHGAFVPMAILDGLAKAMDEMIPKKILTRISAARTRETEELLEQETLCDLYNQAFPQDEEGY